MPRQEWRDYGKRRALRHCMTLPACVALGKPTVPFPVQRITGWLGVAGMRGDVAAARLRHAALWFEGDW